jgi:hypothetical protein
MKTRHLVICILVLGLTVSLGDAQSRAGRGAKRGAAMGAVWGLIFGGDVGSAVEGAAAGAAVGAVGGAVSDSYAKKDRKRYEQQRAQAYAEQQAREAEAERQKLEQERQQLEAEKKALEEQQKAQQAASTSATGDPVTEEEWIAYIGVDNWNALTALVDCQHERALLLAQAAATIDDPEFRLASRWIEVFVAVDRKDQPAAEELFPVLASLDPEVDTAQQASIEADKAVLEIRDIRRQEGISCQR